MTSATNTKRSTSAAKPADGKSYPRRATPVTRYVLNVRLLLISIVVVAVLGLVGAWWYNRQVEQSGNALLAHATELESEGKWVAASEFLYRYLRLHPEDVEIQIRLAQTFDKAPRQSQPSQRVTALYYQAVGAAPERADLRRRLAELLWESGQFVAAQREAAEVLKQTPEDSVAARIVAMSAYSQAAISKSVSWDDVKNDLEAAVDKNPADFQLAAALAHLYRDESRDLFAKSTEPATKQTETKQPETKQTDEKPPSVDRPRPRTPLDLATRKRLADAIMDRLVAKNPQVAEALLARFEYRLRYQLKGHDADMETAIKLGPKNNTVVFTAARYFQRPGATAAEKERALKLFDALITLAPADERGYLGRGQLLWERNERELAIQAWRQGVERVSRESLSLPLRLAGTYVALRRWDDYRDLMKSVDAAADRVLLNLPGKQRTSLRNTIEFVKAQAAIARGESDRATAPLRGIIATYRASAQTEADAAQHLQAHVLLGAAHGELDEWDLAASVFDDALQLAPQSTEIRLLSADAWLRAGRSDAAVQHARQAVDSTGTPQAWLTLLRCQLQQQLLLPAAERDLAAIEETFAKLPAAVADSPTVTLLRADYEAAKPGDDAKPRALAALRIGAVRHAKDPDYWWRAALAYQRLGDTKAADQAQTQALALIVAPVSRCLLQAEMFQLRGQPDKARQIVEATLPNVPVEQRGALELFLTRLNLNRAGDGKENLLNRFEKLAQSADVRPRVIHELLDVALAAREFDKAQVWEVKLKEIEGNGGFYWRYFRAQRLVLEATDRNDPRLEEAAKLVSECERQRPNWPLVSALAGHVAERQGRVPQAVESLSKAIALGDRRIATYERLIMLHYAQGNLADAQRLLSKMGNATAATERLESLSIAVAARQNRRIDALKQAQDAVQRRPKELPPRIWLANMLYVNGQPQEAERELRTAIAQHPKDARSHNALFVLQVQAGQTDAARETLRGMMQQADIKEDQKPLILAQGYEALGDRQQAEKHYREVLAATPNNAAVQLKLSSLLMNSDLAGSEELLRSAIQNEPKSDTARRTLALVLAMRGGDERWTEAQRLLTGDAEASSVLDERLRALLLMRRGGDAAQQSANVAESRGILEKLVADPAKASANDRLLLAGLLEAEKKYAEARRQFELLLTTPRPAPTNIALFADFMLRHTVEFTDGAEKVHALVEQFDAVVKAAPEDRRLILANLAIRTRWLANEKRDAEIEPLVEAAAKQMFSGPLTAEEKLKTAATFGALYSAVKQYPAAERWFRRVVRLEPKSYEALSACLFEQQKVSEALTVFIDASSADDSPRPAILAAGLLFKGPATAEDFRRVEPLLAKTLQKHPENTDLLTAVALVRTTQSRNTEAIRLLRDVVRLAPQDVLALNNLATLLSEEAHQADEAIELVNRAFKVVGRLPALLDTLGTVYVRKGDMALAVQTLEEATSQPVRDPRCYFHLALAYAGAGQGEKARAALKKARELGLDQQFLTPHDRDSLAKLDREK